MEQLLPSDIARLVYGYLTEEKCDAAAQLFLETSDQLKECNSAHKKGRKFITKILGLCLVDILNLFTDAACMLKNYREKQQLLNKDLVCDSDDNGSLNVELNNVLQELSNVLLINENSDKSRQKTVFVRISIPQRKKSLSSSNDSPDKKDAEKKDTDKKENEKKKDQCVTDESFESTTVAKNVSSSLDDFDLNMMQTLLDNTALHERIAENINKAIDSSGEINNPESNEKKIVETVLHSTEADPIFEELLHMLAVPRKEDTTTPEDTDKEGGDPAEGRIHVFNQFTPQEEEAMKRLEADNNLAIEGILAGNKTMQEQANTSTPSNQVEEVVGGGLLSPTPPMCAPVPITSSTPLQPVISTGISTLVGILSPASSGQTLLIPVQSIPRVKGREILRNPSRLTPILPKSSDTEHTVYQIQAVPDSMKRPRVRTRGGIQKGITRGVKSIAPQITQISDGRINVIFPEKTYSMRTRSMNKTYFTKSNKSPKLQRIQEEIPIIDLEALEETDTQINVQMPSSESSDVETNGLPNLQEEPHNPLSVVDVELTIPSSDSENNLPVQRNEKETQLINIEELDDVEENLNSKAEQSVEKVKDVDSEIVSKLNDQQIEKSDSSVQLLGKDIGEKSTPDQQNIVTKIKKRVSLSTPRRGSHIRTLDFKTPEKPMNSRKSLTSPKQYSKTQKIDLKMEKAKRGILKSPEFNFEDKKKTELQNSEKINDSSKNDSSKKDWDADLRKFTDIPTCVGLKRKTVTKKEPKRLPRNQVRKKASRNLKKKNVNLSPVSEELIKQIEKNVADAFNEEELSNNLNYKDGKDNIIHKDSEDLENVNKSRTSSCSENMVIDEHENDTELLQHSRTLSRTNKPNNQDLEVQNVVSSPEMLVLNPPRKEGECQLDILDENTRDNMITLNKGMYEPDKQKSFFDDTSTPLKEVASPLKEDTVTPTTKLILNQLVVNLSPNSPSSSNLESILIREGTRLEQEKISETSKPDNTKSVDCVEPETQPTNISKPQTTNKSSSDDIKRHIPVECVMKQFVLQTPAKFSTSHIPLGFPVEVTPLNKVQPSLPVEMTPLSKVLHSETKYLSTALVTPTLPATPKPRDDRSPNRTDSLINDTSENENEDCSVQPEKQVELASDKDNYLDANGVNLAVNKVSDSVNESLINCTNIKSKTVINHKQNLRSFSATPRVKLSPKESKLVKSTINNKTQRKRNTRRISSSSDSQEQVNVLDAKKLVPSKEKINDIAQALSESKSCNEINLQKMNPTTPKQRKTKLLNNGNKTVIKSKKNSPNKKHSNLDLLKKEEEVLKECLENAKARALFGVISSNSDSSDDSIKEPLINSSDLNNVNITKVQDSSKPELQHAYHKLQEIKSTSMLLSSSSSDDEDFNLNSSSNAKVSPVSECRKDLVSKCDLPKSISKFTDGISKAPSITNENIVVPEIKKVDLLKKTDKIFKDFAKSISREKDESCESFPALYLSEESNMSGISDSHNVKFFKSRKSPSVSCENILLKKSTLSSAGVSPQPKTNLLKSSVSKQIHMLPRQAQTTAINKDPLDTYEYVIHSNTNTLNSISVEESEALSKYLDDYTFSFTLDGEGRDVMSKTLRTSPFFSIFEMSPERKPPARREISNPSSGENAMSPDRTNSDRLSSLKTVSPVARRAEWQRSRREATSPLLGAKRCERIQSPPRDRQRSGRDKGSPVRHTPGSLRPERGLSPQRDRQRSGRDKSSPLRTTPGTGRGISPYRERLKSGRADTSPTRHLKGTVRSERGQSPQRDRLRSGRDNSSPIRHLSGTARGLSPHRERQRSERDLSPLRERDRLRSGRDDTSPMRHTPGTMRSERGLSPQLDRQRKRQRSDSSSDDDRRKYTRYSGSVRRDYRQQPFRRNKLHNKKFKFYSRFPISSRYPDRRDMYRGQRHQVPESNKRSHKLCSTEHNDWNKFNDSFRNPRSNESDRLLIEQSFRSSELSDSPHEIVHHNFTENQIMKKIIPNSDREDGELSDTSGFLTANVQDALTEAKRKKLIALLHEDQYRKQEIAHPVSRPTFKFGLPACSDIPRNWIIQMSDDSRANLLKKVDLDSFLTMLHGAEKTEK